MNLNTQQIILLCLLVSFVTSIATGITTVSLLEQAPDPVTNTINRVVERTIERVTEPKEEEDGNRTVVTTPERIVETVVVNQEDLTVDAVAKNSKSIVRIIDDRTDTFVTLGIVVSEKEIIADSNVVNSSAKLIAKTNQGNVPISFVSSSKDFGFSKFKIADDSEVKLSPAEFGNANNLQLAQTVISISGADKNIISSGIIGNLNVEGEGEERKVSSITANIDTSSILVGAVIVNLSGKIVGINTFNVSESKGVFAPANLVTSYLASQSQ